MKINKLSLALFTALSVAAVSTSVNAAKINFTGTITDTSCEVNPGSGAGGSANDININLGAVSKNDVIAAGMSSVAGSYVSNASLEVSCSEVGDFTKVKMSFDPHSGSGLNASDARLLKILDGNDSAKGVGIALVDENNQVINLQDPSQKLTANMTVNGSAATASFLFRAGYMADGQTITAGKADGTLPFVLTYE